MADIAAQAVVQHLYLNTLIEYHDYDDGTIGEYEFDQSYKAGELAGCTTVKRKVEMLSEFNNANSIKFSKCEWKTTMMDVNSLQTRLNGLQEQNRNVYHFYARSMALSCTSPMQAQIDAHYKLMYKINPEKTMAEIKSKRMRARVQVTSDSDVSGCPGTKLPEHAKNLQANCRKSVLTIFGPFFNLYRSKVTIDGSKESTFFFVDPIPLCLLNLHHPEMRTLVKQFKALKPSEDPLIISSTMNRRGKLRVGSTFEKIYEDHMRKAVTDVGYFGSVPLILRIFLDGAKVSDWTNLSVTPILGDCWPERFVFDTSNNATVFLQWLLTWSNFFTRQTTRAIST